MLRSMPELELSEPALCPLLIVNCRPLRHCTMLVGLAWRFSSRTVTWLAEVVNVARALTGIPPVVAPVGVSNPITAACEARQHVTMITNASTDERRATLHPKSMGFLLMKTNSC